MSIKRGKVVLEGTLGGNTDIWSMGFHMPDLSGKTGTQLQDLADDIYTGFADEVWIGTSLAGNIPDEVTWDRVKVYDIDATNHVARAFTSTIDTPTAGGTSVDSLPTEVAECVSLMTALAGARHRGRMYFPCLAANALHDEGLLEHSVRSDLATSMRAFLASVNVAYGGTAASVYSTVLDALFAVTAVRVGDVFDSQRRRRNSIIESYSTVTV